jgi:hypothetical protein
MEDKPHTLSFLLPAHHMSHLQAHILLQEEEKSSTHTPQPLMGMTPSPILLNQLKADLRPMLILPQ